MKRSFVFLATLLLALIPLVASADDGSDDKGLLLRIRGDVQVPRGETVGTLIAIDGDATIDGTVKNAVLVINGTAIVRGIVEGNLTVISGEVDLQAGGKVKDVTAVRSKVVRDSGATVTGKIRERERAGIAPGVIALFSIFFWVGMTIAVLAAGFIFAAVGGRQLTGAARAMTRDPLNSFLGVVFVWIGLPLLAVLAMVTVVGLPLGLGALVFLMPALWFLGYVVAGAGLGGLLTGLIKSDDEGHPFLATFLGLLALQLLVLVPVVGALLALLAGAWGAGALASTAYKAAGGKGVSSSGAEAGAAPATA